MTWAAHLLRTASCVIEPEPKEPEEPDFIIQEDEDDNAEESDETNLYLFIQNHADVVEKKSSNKAKIDKMTKIK